ncbi:MAG TPA: arsinothricin resistance N-acetyltransferase ArsN1 family B [Steroidobacteraceae bacterium]|nr:arsinothricin resistance N-acetyltransferase ArsN1 family B [Steroidobacteraceae bacterium]
MNAGKDIDCLLRSATAADAEALADIYNPYVLATVITFEEQPVSAADMAGRVAEVGQLSLPWLVAERDGRVVGYAYATRWKSRSAYRLSTETAVYLEPGSWGRGVGSRLYAQLLLALHERGIHVALAGIALPNPASVALHEKLGFRKVGQLPEVGFKLGRWVDVGYWQRIP